MRRRICLAGAALSVCSLAFVASSATAASTSVATQKVACKTQVSVMIPSGESGISPPAQQGTEYGAVRCAKLFGSGVQWDSFTVPASGDTIAKFAFYFRSGTVYGKYDLTPNGESSSFLETDWTGTAKVLGGTGIYKGVIGAGTMVCKSLDGVHTTCTDRLKLRGA